MGKQIDITYDFLFQTDPERRYKYIHLMKERMNERVLNPLYGKELYIPSIPGKDSLSQALGNLGAFGNNEYDSTVDYFLIPDQTIDNLLCGIKDKVIAYIENICEKQKAKAKKESKWRFNMIFILENDVVNFIKERSLKCNDELTLSLINTYINN